MHQYKIVIFEYLEDGSILKQTPRYFDSPEQAKVCYEQYHGVKRPDGMSKYRVDFYVCVYKAVSDPAAFFAQFED